MVFALTIWMSNSLPLTCIILIRLAWSLTAPTSMTLIGTSTSTALMSRVKSQTSLSSSKPSKQISQLRPRPPQGPANETPLLHLVEVVLEQIRTHQPCFHLVNTLFLFIKQSRIIIFFRFWLREYGHLFIRLILFTFT